MYIYIYICVCVFLAQYLAQTGGGTRTISNYNTGFGSYAFAPSMLFVTYGFCHAILQVFCHAVDAAQCDIFRIIGSWSAMFFDVSVHDDTSPTSIHQTHYWDNP